MYCKKCGNQIGDASAFCPACGVPINDSAVPADPRQRYQQSAAPYRTYQPANNPVPPATTYQPAYRSPAAPAKAVGRNQPRISKGGYIAAVILASVAMGVFFLSLIGDFGDLFKGSIYASRYIAITDISRWMICIIPFFVLCLLLKKIPAVITAIPLLYLMLDRTIALMSSVFHFRIFGVDYNFNGVGLVFLFIQLSGIVMYFITLLLKSRPLVMKIITAALIGSYALYILYDYISSMARMSDYYYSPDAMYMLGWFGYAIGFVCLYAAMIVIVFTSKAKK